MDGRSPAYPPDRRVSWCLLALATLVMLPLLSVYHHVVSVLAALFVLSEIRGCLNTIYLVTLMNEEFAAQPTKNGYALVSSGAPCAGIVFGFLIGFEGHLLQLSTWLLVSVVLDGLAMLVLLLKLGVPAVEQGGQRGAEPGASVMPSPQVNGAAAKGLRVATAADATAPRRDRANDPLARRLQWHLPALVATKVTVLKLLEYQWDLSVAHYYETDEVAMAEYFAFFYAIADLLIILVQVSLAGRFIDRFGVGAALLGFPLVLTLVAVAGLAVNSAAALFLVFSVGRGCIVLRRSVHDPALASAYGYVDERIRNETVIFAKGIVKPLAEIVASAGSDCAGGGQFKPSVGRLRVAAGDGALVLVRATCGADCRSTEPAVISAVTDGAVATGLAGVSKRGSFGCVR